MPAATARNTARGSPRSLGLRVSSSTAAAEPPMAPTSTCWMKAMRQSIPGLSTPHNWKASVQSADERGEGRLDSQDARPEADRLEAGAAQAVELGLDPAALGSDGEHAAPGRSVRCADGCAGIGHQCPG